MERSYIKRKPPKPRIERIPLAIPRPGEMKKEIIAVKVFPSGREVCNLLCKAGADEYQRRKRVAWEKQGKLCSICHQHLNWGDSTVDHIKVRGMGGGSRDDRQENIAAAHAQCNADRGSRTHGFYGVA